MPYQPRTIGWAPENPDIDNLLLPQGIVDWIKKDTQKRIATSAIKKETTPKLECRPFSSLISFPTCLSILPLQIELYNHYCIFEPHFQQHLGSRNLFHSQSPQVIDRLGCFIGL